jgi:AraC-like DNA-binding protein
VETRTCHSIRLPENVLSSATSRRAWNGVSVEVTEFHCSGRVVHQLHQGTDALLSVVLEEIGGRSEPRLRENQPCPIGYMPKHMHFAPAGMETWGYTDDIRYLKDASLTFDLAALAERLGTEFDADVIATPRLRFADDRIWTLVRLLADAANDPDPSAQLYGDGLTAAIAAQLFNDGTAPPTAQRDRGLAPWQLRRVVEYLDAHLPQRIELAQLATIAELSQSHFSRAFKTSTGMSPYHWQLDARIRRAQTLLFDTHKSLEQVARSTGFADAVHFGRTFRKLTGATPAAWRRAVEATEQGPAAGSD